MQCIILLVLEVERQLGKESQPVKAHLYRIPWAAGLIVTSPAFGLGIDTQVRMHVEEIVRTDKDADVFGELIGGKEIGSDLAAEIELFRHQLGIIRIGRDLRVD